MSIMFKSNSNIVILDLWEELNDTLLASTYREHVRRKEIQANSRQSKYGKIFKNFIDPENVSEM